MSFRKLSRLMLALALTAPVSLAATACSSGPNPATHPVIKAGEMPQGGEWQGVYFSPLYGYLHIVTDGKAVNGAWRTAAGDAFGELHGEIDGNVLKYEWKERRIGAVGADAVKKGKGYFVYTIPKEGEAHEIHGEWGLGDDTGGNKWQAVKQKNMPPDLKSVQPDEYEGRVNGGGWDSGDSGGDQKEGGDKPDMDSN
jgi:hypothetical protein